MSAFEVELVPAEVTTFSQNNEYFFFWFSFPKLLKDSSTEWSQAL